MQQRDFRQLRQKIQRIYRNRYTNLLIGLISLLLFASLIDGRFVIGGIIIAIGFLTNILLVLKTLDLPKKVNFYLKIIAIIAFVLSVINQTISFNQSTIFLSFITAIVYIVFLSMAIIIISKNLLNSKEVTADILKGGIAIYIMLGLLWYLFYSLILLIDVDAFNIQAQELNTYELVHFSYTTLTTIGYGDISPVNRFAMFLANLEGMVGQMFPAIFIARLVSLYTQD